MRLQGDKYAMVAGEFLSSGAELKLPLNALWPEFLTLENNQWQRTPAEGFNVFKLMQVADERGYGTPFWITLRDGELAGGKLKEGASGVSVAAWQWTNKNEKWQGDISPGNVKAEPINEAADEGDPAVAMRPRVVFHADEWEELPALPGFAQRKIPSRDEAQERAEQVERLGAGCEIKHGGSLAYYNPSLNYISIPPQSFYTSLREYYWALFEQIGHALAGRHQMNLWEGQIEADMANDMAFKKLYAKMVAAMLAYETGIDVLE